MRLTSTRNAPVPIPSSPRPAAGWRDRPLVKTPPYAGVPLPDLSAARTWRPGDAGPDGSAANRTITATYHALDQAMTRYLGEPALPNWMTFGKYASREAGVQILRMEELLKIAQRLDANALANTLEDFVDNQRLLGKQGLEMLAYSGSPVAFMRNVKLMRDALVAGNTGVYEDVAPAYDQFLRSEAAGGDGLAALKAAGYGRPPHDPQGLLLQAFTLYQQAGRQRAALPPAARQALIARANLLIVTHEQMDVVQGPHIFGDPAVAKLMQRMTRTMTVTDARGTRTLLPDGGNWADFATRMGYREVAPGTPDAIPVKDQAGRTHLYVVDPARPGTISAYFASALNARDARTMIGHTPAPLPPAYDDPNPVGHGLRRMLTGALASWPLAAEDMLRRAIAHVGARALPF
jgi:hypothetical protein